MAINKQLMLKKLESLRTNGKSDRKENAFFKPIPGDQEVRFLPSPDEDPFKEYWFHYDLGSEGFLCPKKNFNEKCAVCEFAWNLWKEGTEDSKKSAKKLFPKQRFFSNVLQRGNEAAGPKPYAYGKETYAQLIELSVDPDYGDITDADAGRDFKLNYKKAETKGAFPKTKLTVKPKESPIAKTKKEIKEILDNCQPIEIFLVRKTTAEVDQLLNEFMKNPYDGEQQKYGNTKSADENDDPESSTDVNSVDAAIDELTNS